MIAAYRVIFNGELNHCGVNGFTYSDELWHHGVLGMKWGVRRWQNEDGSLTPEGKRHYGYSDSDNRRIVPKGAVIYRTSVNKKEDNSGHAYVSISQVDRNHYRGGAGAQWLKDTSGNPNAQLYEHKFKLKEDLKVASKEDIINALKELTNEEKKVIDKASKDAYKKYGLQLYKGSAQSESDYDKIFENTINSISNKNGKKYSEFTTKEIDEMYKTYDKKVVEHDKKVAQSLIKEYSKLSVNDMYELGTSRSFGMDDQTKNIVIKKLQDKGFNAMIDQASIGTSSKNQKIYGKEDKMQIVEGVSPTIIFDRSILESKGNHKIGRGESDKAGREYEKWRFNKLRNS